MRFILAIVAVFFTVVALIAGLDVLTIEGREGATVFQQLTARLTFGLSALVAVVAGGLSGVISANKASARRAEKLLKDIAASNAALALNDQKRKDAEEAPVLAAAEAERSEKEEATRARLAAYRKELQGGSA